MFLDQVRMCSEGNENSPGKNILQVSSIRGFRERGNISNRMLQFMGQGNNNYGLC